MTIRQLLRRWFRFLWMSLLAVGVLAGSWRAGTWLTYYTRMAVLSFLVVSVMGVFGFGFVCPRCGKSLVLKAAAIFDGRPCACSKCGVSLDEPAKSEA
jgi:hypothetical protein